MSDKKSQPYRYRGVEANRRSEKRSSKNSLERYHEARERHFTELPWRLKLACRNAKHRAGRKGYPFDLDYEFLAELYNEQEGMCEISGRLFTLEHHETLKIHPDSPSLDKVVPELGYTKGNVRFVTYHVNVCLLDMGEDILRDLCEDIINRERGV